MKKMLKMIGRCFRTDRRVIIRMIAKELGGGCIIRLFIKFRTDIALAYVTTSARKLLTMEWLLLVHHPPPSSPVSAPFHFFMLSIWVPSRGPAGCTVLTIAHLGRYKKSSRGRHTDNCAFGSLQEAQQGAPH
jgi:hypothetical protein